MFSGKFEYLLPIENSNGDTTIPVALKRVNTNDSNMWVWIVAKLIDEELYVDAETTEQALHKIARLLPTDWKIHSCISCHYGHFCPVGNGDNEIFCITEFEPEQISDLCHVTEDYAERSKRLRTLFYSCEKFEHQTVDYYTYNDFLFETRRNK